MYCFVVGNFGKSKTTQKTKGRTETDAQKTVEQGKEKKK